MRLKLPLLASAVAAMQGCGPAPRACLMPNQKPMLELDFYFGRDVAGRALVTDAEWDDFAAHEITPRFPDGFSVLDANGQWLNPASGALTHEPTKILRVVAPASDTLAARVEAVSVTYRRRFHQNAVGMVSAPVCAAF
ncbi:MAG: DUF3574 domain-containing protein [Rhodospirillales bacterium]